MADITNIIEYLGNYCRFTNLPSYKEIREGLISSRRKVFLEHSDESYITPLIIPEEIIDEKSSIIKRVASHLWGGNDKVEKLFKELEIKSIEEMSYADTKPLRIRLNFSDKLEEVFYAKKFDERRLFGLELENLLSQYKYNYSASGGGIYEEEIKGVEAIEIAENTRKERIYLEELVKLDYRSFVMLLGDMHNQNYLISRIDYKNDKEYCARPIDFDKLFEVGELRNGFVLSLNQRKTAISKMGWERYRSIINLEREKMRKRYLENSARIISLLNIISSSDSCNIRTENIRNSLIRYYSSEKALLPDFSKARNMGHLLGIHIRAQLNL